MNLFKRIMLFTSLFLFTWGAMYYDKGTLLFNLSFFMLCLSAFIGCFFMATYEKDESKEKDKKKLGEEA